MKNNNLDSDTSYEELRDHQLQEEADREQEFEGRREREAVEG